ncbi:excalibur calcium-binding domain-containing protein [uncultured Maritimibacter sp.]|jgi:hypothetical protein|uniref:excalibur calcium-binding domain-containing protein n=1 Tax=uncultured Maritimibacter sp. TaxID=991866 RepID=UPI002632C5C0|nr:excalibur calcium-binding domain-containing protein [uncultured Maritimibacter sp.]
MVSCVALVACGVPNSNISFDPNDASLVGVSSFVRAADAPRASATSDRDCSDFGSGAEAQRFFQSAGGPTSDPHDLDGDGDGFACEWGTELRKREAAARAAARSRAAAASRCYTGPRGGTYTITASGRKNYSGC